MHGWIAAVLNLLGMGAGTPAAPAPPLGRPVTIAGTDRSGVVIPGTDRSAVTLPADLTE